MDDQYTAAAEQFLIVQARHNPDAFRELYRRYFPRVYAYVAYRIGQAWDTEDVVAEIFTSVVKSLHTFEYRGEGAFAAWVFRIASNAINLFYRQHHGDAETPLLDDLPDIRGSDADPEEAVIRKERFRRLRDRISTLSPRRQEIITLKFFGELKNHEIAAVVGLDERTVASHLCRAVEDLQRRYADELDRKPADEPESHA
ncbi:MAG: sigma-70 family RNA polymerase sigma factor [Anaerolineae bacterium]|nr:sigma-70 family RNA polymerase sigma factor [Anaerolineae bacterium]